MRCPSDVLRLVAEIGNRQPTRDEWAVIRSTTNKAIAHTIADYIKMGQRPPALDNFGGEKPSFNLHLN